MLPAVQFHNQVSIRAGEIGYVRTDFVLAAEFPALEVAMPQVMPKQLLGICLPDAQLARPVYVQTLHP